RDVLIISTPQDLPRFESLLGDGTKFGMAFSYAVQPEPNGLPEAYLIGKSFVGDEPSALILGDNIFYGSLLSDRLRSVDARDEGATVFTYPVNNPERYGVMVLDQTGKPLAIEEKPKNPATNLAVTGLYFYDGTVVERARGLRPSARGELEISALNNGYIANDSLHVEPLGRGFAWLDTGTHDSLLDASNYIATIERRQGQKIACVEEIAWRRGWISDDELAELAHPLINCGYGDYLMHLIRRRGDVI
ncbi:MAG: hypothetical protein CFH10_01160, partial [Alphaproteobacteria bacterium MarineAlpha4_Bin2]